MTTAVDSAALGSAAGFLASRRSIRRYRQDAVPREVIDAILECALNAPSAHYRQPWRFAVLSAPEPKARLARAMGQRLRADRLRDGGPPSAIEADVSRSFKRICTAPVVVVVANSQAGMEVFRDAARREVQRLMAFQSTAMAVQNLLLGAHAAGLGACWTCAPLFCADTVREALDLPGDWQPQAMVTIGLPASAGKAQPRWRLSEVARYLEDA